MHWNAMNYLNHRHLLEWADILAPKSLDLLCLVQIFYNQPIVYTFACSHKSPFASLALVTPQSGDKLKARTVLDLDLPGILTLWRNTSSSTRRSLWNRAPGHPTRDSKMSLVCDPHKSYSLIANTVVLTPKLSRNHSK